MDESGFAAMLQETMVRPAKTLDTQRVQLMTSLLQRSEDCKERCAQRRDTASCAEDCEQSFNVCKTQVSVQYSVPVTRLKSCISACAEKDLKCVERCGRQFKANCESCYRAVQRLFDGCVQGASP